MLDTHSMELGEDLTQVSVLVDEKTGMNISQLSGEAILRADTTAQERLFWRLRRRQNQLFWILRQIGGIAERKFEWVFVKNNIINN